MKTDTLSCLCALALLLGACTSNTAVATRSCDRQIGDVRSCVDYTCSGGDVELIDQACRDQGGAPGPGCEKAGAGGACASTATSTCAQTVWYYDLLAERVKTICAAMGARFVSPQ